MHKCKIVKRLSVVEPDSYKPTGCRAQAAAETCEHHPADPYQPHRCQPRSSTVGGRVRARLRHRSQPGAQADLCPAAQPAQVTRSTACGLHHRPQSVPDTVLLVIIKYRWGVCQVFPNSNKIL